MKKLIVIFIVGLFFWYVESRSFVCENNKCVTVWKMLDSTCYILPYKYYGLLKPSKKDNFVITTKNSIGVNLIWKSKADTILVEFTDDGQIFNENKEKMYLVDYKLNRKYNDSLYTYFDSKLHLRRYRKNVEHVAISINDMGAL